MKPDVDYLLYKAATKPPSSRAEQEANFCRLFSVQSTIKDWLWRISKERQRHFEMMAAAYLKETGLPPSKAMLVEQREGNVVRWWYESRKP